MYIVLYSKNPYLLARMATDLQLEGINNDWNWNNDCHPFLKGYQWMAVFTDAYFNFHTHKCFAPDKRIWLLDKNYLETLELIIKNK